MAKPDKKKKDDSPKGGGGGGSYFKRTLLPLQCLFFLLPLLVIYEIGTFLYATNHVTGEMQTIRARAMFQSSFELIGVTGYSLPIYLVIGVLVIWHLVNRDKFSFEPKLYAKMALESAMWALPLVALMTLIAKYAHPAAGLSTTEQLGVREMLVLSVGAGIYEELLFRLMGLSLIRLFAQHVLRAKLEQANYLAIIVTSIAFALYHYTPGAGTFTFNAALQYCLAGVFFSGVYAYRGFGIVVGAHAMYDIMVVFIHWYASAK
jgi:membrane protease YdiL (CAAX protease family)